MHEKFFINLIRKGVFKVDSKGRIWRILDGRFPDKIFHKSRAERLFGNGYFVVSAGPRIKQLSCGAHRLIWVYFNGRIPRGLQINHKNGVKTDNRPENLELVTPKENIRHAREVLKTIDNNGEKCATAKLTNKDVTQIKSRLSCGETGRSIAADFGVHESTVSRIKLGKSWKHL